MYSEIVGTDERVRAIPGVRDRRVRAIKVRLYTNIMLIYSYFHVLVLWKYLVLAKSCILFLQMLGLGLLHFSLNVMNMLNE